MSRLLPRYTDSPVEHDPLEQMINELRAREEAARAAVARGSAPDADSQSLRGIPVVGRGVGGVSPGTRPDQVIWRLDR